MRRRLGLIATLAACVTPRLGFAAAMLDHIEGDPVYIGQAIVTGTDNRDRPRGLGLCLGEVLIKASGDPNIIAAPGYLALQKQAATMVTAIAYHDRMSGLPKHDEQGTRDRPFDLIALFDKPKIAAALARLGGKVWTGARPTIFLVTQVQSFSGNFLLTAGPAEGYDQAPLMRAAVADAATRAALPVLLPSTATTAAPPGAIKISGSLLWSDAADGWIAQWTASSKAGPITWGERGVSFDAAFNAALTGALGVASGHQPPRG